MLRWVIQKLYVALTALIVHLRCARAFLIRADVVQDLLDFTVFAGAWRHQARDNRAALVTVNLLLESHVLELLRLVTHLLHECLCTADQRLFEDRTAEDLRELSE